METLLKKLRRDYPKLRFAEGETFCWAPHTKQIFYTLGDSPAAVWSLLHETAHALLEHTVYSLDFELIHMEVEAWEMAQKIGITYGIVINENHIQDCLDSYRDWLYGRSICPSCETKTVQRSDARYACFNCHANWEVAASRFCRPYRQFKEHKKSPASLTVTGDSLR
jgi:hypothetical protein